MNSVLVAATVGIALAAAVLGLDGEYPPALTGGINNTSLLIENAPSLRSTPDFPGLTSPASHRDSNTETDKVALNGNLLAGKPTLVCTEDDKLFPVLRKAVDIWNDALAPLEFGSEAEVRPFVLHTVQNSLPASCKDTPGKLDVHVKVLHRADKHTDQYGCDPGINACYVKLPGHMNKPPRQTFRRSSSANPDAAEIVTASRTPSVSTLVHELGHVLGLKDYSNCASLRSQGLAHQDPDPLDQHHALMYNASDRDCRPPDEATITGRDLRDLYEAYHVGAITNIQVDGDVYVGSKQIDDMMLPKVVEFTLRWGADGIEEASHGASHIAVLRQDVGSDDWHVVHEISVRDEHDAARLSVDVLDTSGKIGNLYKVVGVTRGDIRWQGRRVETSTDPTTWAFDREISLGSIKYTEGDPTFIVGIEAYNRSQDGVIGPEVLSASVSPRYCWAGDTLATSLSVSGGVATRSKGLRGPDETGYSFNDERAPCGSVGGAREFLAIGEWGSGISTIRSPAISLSVSVHETPSTLELASSPPRPTSCTSGRELMVGWEVSGGTGAKQVWIGEELDPNGASPATVSCPIVSGTSTALALSGYVLDAAGNGASWTAPTVTVIPDPFANLHVARLTTRSATLDWSPVGVTALVDAQAALEDQYYYEVQKDGKTVLAEGEMDSLQLKGTSHTFENLTPGTPYVLGVRLVTNMVWTDWVEHPVTTLLGTPQPTVAFGAIADDGTFSATVAWPKVDCATGYEVVINDGSGAGDPISVSTPKGKECEMVKDRISQQLAKLDGTKTYTISVVAVRRADDQAEPVRSEAGTVEFCLGPCEMRVSNVSLNSLRVDWEGLFERALFHEVRIVQDGKVVANIVGQSKGLTIPSSRITTGGALKVETTYRAEVRTWYTLESGWGAWAGVEFTTPAAPKPKPLTLSVSPSAATCLAGESVSVSWSMTGGSGKYEVSVDGNKQSGSSATVTCQATAGDQSVTVVVTDKTHATLTKTQTITLTVTKPQVEAPTELSVRADVTSLTLAWEGPDGASGYGVRRDGGAETTLPATTLRHPFPGLTPSTKHKLEVRAYIDADHSVWSSIEATTLSPPPLVLTASAEPTSCETNAQVTVSWTVTGGSDSYTVSVDGDDQSGSTSKVTCQATAGTQSVTVKAQDKTYTQLAATQTITLTVTKPAPPTLVTAQIRARRLADNRVEFRLRLADGTEQTTDKRYMKLPEVTAGRWYSSSAFTTSIEGVEYALGVVSVRLDNTVCPAFVAVTFIPAGGERITPTQYKLSVDREADLWAMTSEFAVPLQPSSAVPDSAQSEAGHWMIEAPEGTNDGPGRAGGAMLGDSTDAPDSAQADNTQASCTDQPTGLQTSNITSSGVRLSWQAVSGASQYDVSVGGAEQALASTQRYHDFTGLAADTDHTLRVRARSWRGASEWSGKTIRTTVSSVPVITITSGASPINEGDNASFTVASDRAPTTALTVKLSITESGAMVSGGPPTEATIASGARTASVTVATEDDERDESDSVVTAKLVAGSGYRPGSPSSAAVTVSDDDGQVSELTLTASASPTSCETGGEVTVSWTVTGGSGSHNVTVDGTARSGSSTKLTCQATAGAQTVTVKATDQAHTHLTATETLTLTVTDPVTLTATVSPTSCETDGEVTVSWTVTGGSGSHTVTVDGNAQTGSSAKVACQATAGTQTVTVKATDRTYIKWSATKMLSLTVTKPAPPSTVEAKLWARRLSDNRIELDLRVVRGTLSTLSKRFVQPPKTTDLRWKQSETLSVTIDDSEYTLGRISARLHNDRCPSRVEVGFLPPKGARLLPGMRFIETNSTVNAWRSSAAFEITLAAPESDSLVDATDDQEPAGDWLDDTPDQTNAGPGTDGGLMSAEAPSDDQVERARIEAQSNGTPVCPSAPGGLSASDVQTDRITLSWTAVSGASQYDVQRDGVGIGSVTTNSIESTGLRPNRSYSFRVRTRDAWGASSWSSTSVTTLPLAPAEPSGLQATATTNSITLTWSSALRATGYQVRLESGSAKSPSDPPRRHTFGGLNPDEQYKLYVRATNRGGKSDWVPIVGTTKPTPVSLSASVSPTSCESGESVTVQWSVSGGSGSYRVTVGGVAKTGSSAKVTCQQTAGAQTIAVVATDTKHTTLNDSESLSVAVKSPPTVTGQVAARLLSSGKIELAFRPTGGSRILPTLRFYTPDTTKLTRWASSSDVIGPAGTEKNRLLGQITVKHIKTTSSYYVDVCFRPAGASQRMCPSQNNFYYKTVTVDRWLYTGAFTFKPLRVSALGVERAQDDTADAQLQPIADGEANSVGTEGGLMSDEE